MAGKRLISLALVGILLVIGCGQAMPNNSRIWGGSDATTGQHAHVASIRVDSAHVCVGSIISEKYILTAGHCVAQLGSTAIDASRVTARVGSFNQFAGGQIVSVKSIVIHPSYGNFLNDLAILSLSEPLTFSDKINKINLAAEDDVFDEGTSVTVTGWGVQESGSSPYKLQQVSMSTLSAADCELQAGYGYESTLCLTHPANTGICRGDDGTGVVSGNKLIGVGSFAFGSCGTKYPDISGKVSFFRSWIDSVIA